MQVPATRHQVLKLWARHERRVITVPAADLFHGATEQHHGIGRRKSDLRLEREFALAGAELDFDGAQRQAKRDDLAAQDFENRLRSEEHTSELQSLTNLVCRLLLEKKKRRPPLH